MPNQETSIRKKYIKQPEFLEVYSNGIGRYFSFKVCLVAYFASTHKRWRNNPDDAVEDDDDDEGCWWLWCSDEVEDV